MMQKQDQVGIVKKAITESLCLKLLNAFKSRVSQKTLNVVDDYEALSIVHSEEWRECVMQATKMRVSDPLTVQYISSPEGALEWHTDREFFGCEVICIWLALEKIVSGVEFESDLLSEALETGDMVFFGGDVMHRAAKLEPHKTRKSIVVHYKIQVNANT